MMATREEKERENWFLFLLPLIYWQQIVVGKDFCFRGIFILLSISAVDTGRIASGRGEKDREMLS